MTILVVQAHPLDESYNAALLDAVAAGLRDAGEQNQVVRLSRGDALTAATFAGVTHAIFIYPTWFGALPAMLLAPLAEVLGPWVDGDQPPATGPLRAVDRLTVITSHGSSRLVNLMQGEPGRHFWKRTALPQCAPGATFTWKPLYKVDRSSAAERGAFITDAAAAVLTNAARG